MEFLFLIYCSPLVLIYFVFCLIFSQIRIGKPELGKGFAFYISRDAIHADYVFDSRFFKDVFPPKGKFIKIGWGDKKIFLETKAWSELKIQSALSAFFGINKTVLRVEFLNEIPPGCKIIHANERQMQVLKIHILESFHGEEIRKRPEHHQKGEYYNSDLRYNCITNCNNWVNRGMFLAKLTNRVWCPISLWL